jgi:glycosyltransferase involved in cell wall biosynthesis
MPDALVSIIIPVYNSAPYLAAAIRSGLGQTWPQKEIIVIDDGSADNSLAVARSFEGKSVRVFSQSNKGASAARNKGLSEARGQFIQFLDGDDLLSPNKIAEQMDLLNGDTDTLAISRTVNFYDGEPLPDDHLQHDEAIEHFDDPVKFIVDMYYKAGIEMEHRGMVTVHSWLSPKNLLCEAGPWNEELSADDDGEYFCRVTLAAKKIVYVPDAVNYYRKYKSNTSLSARNDTGAMQSKLLANELKYKHLKAASTDPMINRAMAKAFRENAVDFYPQNKDLYLIAEGHVKELGGIDYVPTLGGRATELIKRVFGWKTAKLLAFRVRQLRSAF